MGWVGACGRVPLVATLRRRDDDPMPTTGRTLRWGGTRSWSVSSRKRARTTSASPAPWDAVRPIMIRQRGRRHHPKGVIARRPRPRRISPPKALVSLTRATDGSSRLDSMVRTASKARIIWATDLRISVPLARLPSTAIHWRLLLCGRPDAWDTGQLTAVRTLPPDST